VRRATRFRAAPGLYLAPPQIFPERRPQPFGAGGIALAIGEVAGSAGLLTFLHALSIRCSVASGKRSLDIGRLIGYSLPSRMIA